MANPKEWISVIIPAAGESSRLSGAVRKPFLKIQGRPLLWYSVGVFVGIANVKEIIIALHADDLATFRQSQFASRKRHCVLKVVAGGSSRADSVKAALKVLDERCTLVAIHDAVRPLVKRSLVRQVITKARRTGAAILAVPVSDTVKKAGRQGHIRETIPRGNLWLAQTPQVFRKDLILEAYRKPRRGATDDAELVEKLGHPVYVVPGSATNIKITTSTDLRLVKSWLKNQPQSTP